VIGITEKGIRAIAEVKQEGHVHPSGFTRVMQAYHVRPTGFNKYCIGVTWCAQVRHNRFKASSFCWPG
jgi:hypothetical protein